MNTWTVHQKRQARQAQGHYCMGMSIHMNKGYYKLPLANIQTTSSLSNQLKAHAQNLDSSTIGTCFNHTSCYDYTTRVNIDFLQSLWNYLQLCYCHPELIHKLTRLKNTKKQNCTIKNRKLTWTSEMHTWSSKHSKTMNLNFLRSLLSYL